MNPETRDAILRIPDAVREFLRRTIDTASGVEVFFLARVDWQTERDARVATITEVDVLARGNEGSVPALLVRAEDWDLAIHNHPGGDLRPSDADTDIAAELGARSVGFAIISSDATQHNLVTAPFPRQEVQPLDVDDVARMFDHGGCLSVGMDDFEARSGQIEMARAAAAALNADEVCAIEAGTGIGKSFAYLVPAILWAVKNRDRVVISTGTIALQEQLVAKDLPFLKRVLPVEFKFALIKGRGNYACLRKVKDLEVDLAQDDLVRDLEVTGDSRQLRDLVEWAGQSGDGSRSDLAWTPESDVWENVMSETDKSLKVNCEHYQECFYYRAKREASKANVLVVNHHLFFADLAVRRQLQNYDFDLVLPSYRRVMFDEAHHLEDVASRHLGVRITPAGIGRRLSRMCSTTGRQRGTVPYLVRRLRESSALETAESIEKTFPLAINEAQQRLRDCFDEIESHLLETSDGSEPGGPPATRSVLERSLGSGRHSRETEGADRYNVQRRYRGLPNERALWNVVVEQLEQVQRQLQTILKTNDAAIESLRAARLDVQKRSGFLLELTSFGSRLEGLIEQLASFCALDDEAQVRWITGRWNERRKPQVAMEFASAPIEVAEHLNQAVYSPLKSVLLTSATLSVAKRVDFFAERLGFNSIADERFRFSSYASPFDFARQSLTVVANDLPGPESPAFDSALPEAVYSLVAAAGGRAFVLFTSYRLLRRTYDACAARLEKLGLVTFAQGDAQRSELLRRFKSCGCGVLFGTDSFWEGVDVPGSALECVVITRLPFRVPTEPLQEARVERLQARGRHPFMNFTLPQAVLKLKQGFGRLIRSTTDQGVVAILDRRIVTKSYGGVFLESLPDSPVRLGSLRDCVVQVESFFASRRA